VEPTFELLDVDALLASAVEVVEEHPVLQRRQPVGDRDGGALGHGK
jgi:hypothetical protein